MLCGPNVNCLAIIAQMLVFGLSNGAALAISAMGVTVIYATVRTLNLAHGDVFALAAVVVTVLINSLGLTPDLPTPVLIGGMVLALAVAMFFGAGLSVGVEAVAFRPFRGKSKLAPLIATLGISFILFQVALVWRTFMHSWIPGEHRSVPGLPEVPTDRIPDLLPGVNLLAGTGVVFRPADVFVLVMALLAAVATTLILQRSRVGKALRAVSQNPQAAQMLGVNLNAAMRQAFALGGALAGAAAFTFAIYYARPYGEHGAQSGLLAFAAALLGGIGSPLGALIAALGIGVFSAFSDYFLTAHWTPVLMLGLLITVLVLRPTGLAASDSGGDELAARDSVILTSAGVRGGQRRWLIVIFAALAILPIILSVTKLGGQSILTGIVVFILLAQGLNILLGLAGVLDFGYAMSFGVGAYITMFLTNAGGLIGKQIPQPIEFLPVLILAALVAGGFGMLKGALATRLRGDYLAVATLAFGLLAQRVVINFSDLTGGRGGVGALPPPTIATFAVRDPILQYALVLIIVLLGAMTCVRLAQSRTGRAWLATSEDEGAAIAYGINVADVRMNAFIISSMLAGVAGALYTGTLAYIDPESLSFHISTLTLTMVILGGAGSVAGAAVGAALIIGYDKVAVPGLAALLAQIWPKDLPIGSVPDIRGASYFNFGLALYLTVLFRARRSEPKEIERTSGDRPAVSPVKFDAARLWGSLDTAGRKPSGITAILSRTPRWVMAVPLVLVIGLIAWLAIRPAASPITSAAQTRAPAEQGSRATAVASEFDGEWSGEGVTDEGVPITVSFIVRGGEVTSVKYGFPGRNAARCTNINYSPITGMAYPKVVAGQSHIVLGTDAVIDATLNGGTAQGTIAIKWVDRYETCNGDYHAEWHAKRQ